MSRSDTLADLVGQPLPDLSAPAPDGQLFALRGRTGIGPLALFFYVHNGTPG